MLKIHFRSVGIGDNIIIEFPNGRIGLVDCNHCWSECLDFLEGQLHAEVLEFVVGTHPDFDHTGGLQSVLEHYEGRVNQFWSSGFVHRTSRYRRLIDYLNAHPEIRYVLPRAGTIFKQGDVIIKILSPPSLLLSNTLSDINNASLVLRIECTSRFSILLAADAQFESWARMVLDYGGQLSSRVLKVSHHGSNYGTSLEVLKRINPEYSIMSVGPHARHQFPHPEVLRFLHAVCPSEKILRTDVDGNITMYINLRLDNITPG